MIILRKTIRWIVYLLGILLAILLIAIAIVRFYIFPHINDYKQTIADKVSQQIQQTVVLGNIVPGWDGLSPSISLQDINILDAQQKSALKIKQADATLSWLSLPMLEPQLSALTIKDLALTILRQADGQIFVAGIAVGGNAPSDFGNWLLSQAKIETQNAEIIWQDQLRKAPALHLKQVNAVLEYPTWRSFLGEHHLSMSAHTAGSAYPILLNADFVGRDTAQLDRWHGDIEVALKQADLTTWKPWLDYPIDLQSGRGDINLDATFAAKQLHKIEVKTALTNITAPLVADEAPFKASALSGLFTWAKTADNTTLSAKKVTLTNNDTTLISNASGSLVMTTQNQKPWQQGTILLDRFNVALINQIKLLTPLTSHIAAYIAGLAPSGELSKVSLTWAGPPSKPQQYQIRAAFSHLASNAYENIPGVSNLTGQIAFNEQQGKLTLDSQNAAIEVKNILRWPVPATKLSGEISWLTQNNIPKKLTVTKLYISSPHISGTVNASLNLTVPKDGLLNLTGDFDHGNAQFAPFYYPTMLGESTLNWLDTSILAGQANNIHLVVKGHLADFPFVNSQNQPDPNIGIFKVSADITQAKLEFGKNWPVIEDIGLNMLFAGKRMELNANKGHIFGVNIAKAKVVIPQLDAEKPMLNITSETEGPIADDLKFINQSPVKEVTLGLTDQLQTTGNGALKLALAIPLHNIEAATYQGTYTVKNATVLANASTGVPEVTAINGALNFNESGINTQNISALVYGDPIKLSANTSNDKTIHLLASGTVSDTTIKKMTNNPLADTLKGSTNWSGEINMKQAVIEAAVHSDLVGLAIDLPAPIGKAASVATPLALSKQQSSTEADQLTINYGQIIAAQILRRQNNGVLTIDKGDIGINTPASLPTESGINVHANLDTIQVDDWLDLIAKIKNNSGTTDIPINQAVISVNQLDLYGRKLNHLKVTARPKNDNINLTITSDEIAGEAQWVAATAASRDGKIMAQLTKLIIPNNQKAKVVDAGTDTEIKRLDNKYPALDIKADNFQLGDKKLGHLELIANESRANWIIQKLRISNANSTLDAQGTWHNWTHRPNTNIKFTLNSSDIGNSLKDFGQPNVIIGGKATMTGQLRWPGSPHEFQTKDLNGDLKLEAAKGQISKVQPGVGRLLGLLSLQSLPRRLTLDFRDLFSEGFAFDKISATANINNGVMHSDDFYMTGPAAEADIKGQINLEAETQALNIKVIPHVSDSLSLAAFAGGPIAGVAAFVAQKLLKDPLNKIGQSEYVITGTWDNPKEVSSNKEESNAEKLQSPLNQQ